MIHNETLRAGFYARVSGDQQVKEETIASQIEALRQRIREDDLTLEEELSFIEDGYSGKTLVRPARLSPSRSRPKHRPMITKNTANQPAMNGIANSTAYNDRSRITSPTMNTQPAVHAISQRVTGIATRIDPVRRCRINSEPRCSTRVSGREGPAIGSCSGDHEAIASAIGSSSLLSLLARTNDSFPHARHSMTPSPTLMSSGAIGASQSGQAGLTTLVTARLSHPRIVDGFSRRDYTAARGVVSRDSPRYPYCRP